MFKMMAVAAALMLSTVAAASAAAPLELYGRLPSVEDMALSPDGEKVAMILTDGEARTVVVQRLADKQVLNVMQAGQVKVRFLQWAGLDHLIVTVSQTAFAGGIVAPRGEYFMAYDFNLATKKAQLLLWDAGDSLNTIFDAPQVRMIDGKPVAFLTGVNFPLRKGVISEFKVPLDSDKSQLTQLGMEDTEGYVLDATGAVVAQSTYNSESKVWTLQLKQRGGWRESRRGVYPRDWPTLVGLGPTGETLLVQEVKDDKVVTSEVSLKDGSWTPSTALDGDVRALFDDSSLRLAGYHWLEGDAEHYSFLNPQDAAAWKLVERAFQNMRVRLVNWSDDHKRLLIQVSSPEQGDFYALAEPAARRISVLTNAYSKLTAQDIAEIAPVRFKAKDGMELNGYLTLPRGKAPKNLPLVVFPHGGPAVRDEPGFDWWAQAMAARGYAVLQVNYRGSDGFGLPYLYAGFGEWGRKMQTDLSDGVRYLAAQGVVDPKRVCIVGASYGGYAALAGAALDPGVYRCAVSVAGLSDLKRFTAWEKNNKGLSSQRYFLRFIGAETQKDPTLASVSPAAHVAQVDIPILLVHGKDDTVVPLEQSQIMADALKAAGKPVELVVLDKTDHWLTRGDTRLSTLNATVTFLEKYNPPN